MEMRLFLVVEGAFNEVVESSMACFARFLG